MFAVLPVADSRPLTHPVGEVVWPAFAVGAPLALAREPDNPYDERAVRSDWNGHKLGYVPRVENTTIASLIEQELSVQARIVRLQESCDPWWRVEYEVSLLL